MKVTLKLYANLADYLPPSAERNEIDMDVSVSASIFDILSSYNVPLKACHLILVNGIFIPPKQVHQKTLEEGDSLAIWPPVAGG